MRIGGYVVGLGALRLDAAGFGIRLGGQGGSTFCFRPGGVVLCYSLLGCSLVGIGMRLGLSRACVLGFDLCICLGFACFVGLVLGAEVEDSCHHHCHDGRRQGNGESLAALAQPFGGPFLFQQRGIDRRAAVHHQAGQFVAHTQLGRIRPINPRLGLGQLHRIQQPALAVSLAQTAAFFRLLLQPPPRQLGCPPLLDPLLQARPAADQRFMRKIHAPRFIAQRQQPVGRQQRQHRIKPCG